MHPWSELVRLSSEPRRRRRLRGTAPRPQYPLRGLGRMQVRVMAVLRTHEATSRQVSVELQHSYDATCAILSALLRDGLIAQCGTTRGPTKQKCRLYGPGPTIHVKHCT